MRIRSGSSQKRSRGKQTKPLQERLAEHAERLRGEAKSLPPGAERQAVLRRAEQAETFTNNDGLLRRPHPTTSN
jgi:hypothetical protein